ncbi:hypothetical protein P170DRAFT_476502 [Aspergillus steynii IBT 23096]|uniref:Uncharacterized protein n=1 Tax=Aspergillus steynii IBT 23096 TaxID=1392250 RepID=A0A2I2G4N2_9EURO|nr:uncharacterized protein P170DRAFT_476502 [Aspergillus steynii IBT 23096]PLB47829.1 hypothetical protein P170DRAFT_476502 [Aspergillus steynii IBT 23096]
MEYYNPSKSYILSSSTSESQDTALIDLTTGRGVRRTRAALPMRMNNVLNIKRIICFRVFVYTLHALPQFQLSIFPGSYRH